MRDKIIETMAMDAIEGAYAAGDDHLIWRRYDDSSDEDIRTLADGRVVFTGDADECSDYLHRVRLKAALSAFLSALEASGRAVVPREPTEAMLDRGGSAIIRPSIYMGGTPPGAKRRARDVWASMLAAHTQEKDA